METQSNQEPELKEWSLGKEPEVAKACSFCGDERGTIILSDEVLGVIHHLCDEVEDEWQMLLTGKDEGNILRVTGYYVPKQEITPSTVKNLDCINKARIEELGIVATIHSHSDMTVFFSTEDETKTNKSLIKWHIVWNNKNEYKAIKVVRLPCGMNKQIEASVVRDLPPLPKVKRVKGYKKIKKTSYTSMRSSYSDHDDWGGTRGNFSLDQRYNSKMRAIKGITDENEWTVKKKDLIPNAVADLDNEIIGGTRKRHAFNYV